MIPRSELSWQATSWQHDLQQLITTPEALFEYLELDKARLPEAKAASQLFPLRTTRAYASRIEKGNFNDPLLKQILPLGAELQSPEGYTADPLNEAHYNPIAGLVHKYKSRALLITSTQCAINCRYCFRREFPYESNRPNKTQWAEPLKYISDHLELNEVILSGGDPLSSSDVQLRWLHDNIAKIQHIKRIRIHTRYPVVLPNRITSDLIEAISNSRLKPIMVIHSNHPQELNNDVFHALQTLANAGVTLLNQSVLLKGINDNTSTLSELSETLFEAGVMPYYLHLLDPVTGAAHFAYPVDKAKRLYKNLLAELPGFLVPKLVQEIPNRPSKTPLAF